MFNLMFAEFEGSAGSTYDDSLFADGNTVDYNVPSHRQYYPNYPHGLNHSRSVSLEFLFESTTLMNYNLWPIV